MLVEAVRLYGIVLMLTLRNEHDLLVTDLIIPVGRSRLVEQRLRRQLPVPDAKHGNVKPTLISIGVLIL